MGPCAKRRAASGASFQRCCLGVGTATQKRQGIHIDGDGAVAERPLIGDQAHFLTSTSGDSVDAIRAFAGDAYAQAKYYPEDSGFLLELEPTVQHDDVSPASERR